MEIREEGAQSEQMDSLTQAGQVLAKRHVGRPAKKRRVVLAPKVPVWQSPHKESMESAEKLFSYSRKPGGGYLAQQRFIDAVISSSKEDEFVTSSWMKVGV